MTRPQDISTAGPSSLVPEVERGRFRVSTADNGTNRTDLERGAIAMTTIRQRNQSTNPAQSTTARQDDEPTPLQSQRRMPTFGEQIKGWFLNNFFSKRLSPEQIRAATELKEERMKSNQEYAQLEYEKVDAFPAGYPRLAALLNSDENFIIFRRFGRLSARLLLHLQSELVVLQKKLDALDKGDDADAVMHWRLRGNEDFEGYNVEQEQLLNKIREKYLQYVEVLDKDVSLRRLNKSTTRDHRSIFDWVRSENPLIGDPDKADFITRFEDFVSLSQRSQSSRCFEDFIQQVLGDDPPSLLKGLLQDSKVRNKTDEPYITIYSPPRLAFLAKCLSGSLVAAVLLIPVYLLFLVEMSRGLMAFVTSIFVLAFVVIMSAVTDAKVHEIFVGAAAYGAVLLVFLGNINNQTSMCHT